MNPSIDPLILGEAADWMVQLQSGSATDEDRRAIAQWQGRSAQHAQAWQRAEAIFVCTIKGRWAGAGSLAVVIITSPCSNSMRRTCSADSR